MNRMLKERELDFTEFDQATLGLDRPEWLREEWLQAELAATYTPRPSGRRRGVRWRSLFDLAVRVGLALPFLLGGAQKFVNPAAALGGPPESAAFFSGMQQTFVFSELAAVQVVVALLLITGVAVPLALAAMAPISLTILPYEIVYFGWPKPLLGGGMLLAQAYLVWVHRDVFGPLLSLRRRPHR